MTTYGDFSSLLQLGVGVGIGLSVFRAPVDLRVTRLTRVIKGEAAALLGINTPFAMQKRRDYLDLKLRLTSVMAKLNNELVKFMTAAVVGAALNLLGLIIATLDPDGQPSNNEILLLFGISVGWFCFLISALEILARRRLSSISHDLVAIQQRTSASAP